MAAIRARPTRLATRDTRAVKPPPKRADAELLTPEHKAWRKEVLLRAGYRCQAVDAGRRCAKAAPDHRLFADHIVERRDGGDALDHGNGQCLCGAHHTLKTIRARAERMTHGVERNHR